MKAIEIVSHCKWMMKGISLLVLGLVLAVGKSICANENNQGDLPESAVGVLGGSLLSEDEKEALNMAIQDEYKARATYQKVLTRFGNIRPFSNIIWAEERHIDALKDLFYEYKLGIPEDRWEEKVDVYETVYDACQAGVDAEVENAALYDKLFAKVQSEDIAMVFKLLQRASEENHLRAFERCVARYQ